MTVSVTSTEAHEGQATSGFWALTLGSIGVVFGDIGTSPLYAFREAVLARRGGPAGNAHHRARRALADPVVAFHRRYRQIRAAAAARRQQRRGRHAFPDGAGATGAGPPKLAAAGARRRRRLDVHRRFHDHAGDFGVVGGRRSQARHARARTLCRSADDLHSRRAVLGAEQRHRARRLAVRAGHGGLVRDAGGHGPRPHQRRSQRAGGDQSLLCDPVHAFPRRHRTGDDGPGVPGRDRR